MTGWSTSMPKCEVSFQVSPLLLREFAVSQANTACSLITDHFGTQIFIDGPETIQRGLQYVTRLEPHSYANTDRRVILLEVLTFYADEPVAPGSIARAKQPAGAIGDRLVQPPAARPFASTTSSRPSTSGSRFGATFPQARPSSGTPDSSSAWRDSPGRFGIADTSSSDRVSLYPGPGRTPLSSRSERIYPPSASASATLPRDEMDMRPTSASQRPLVPRSIQPSEQIPYHRPITADGGAFPSALSQRSGRWSPPPLPILDDRHKGRRHLPASSAAVYGKTGYGYDNEEDRHHAGRLCIDQLKPLEEPREGSYAYPPPPLQRYDPGSRGSHNIPAPLQHYGLPTAQRQPPVNAGSKSYTQQQPTTTTTLPSSRYTSQMHIPPFHGSPPGFGASRSADGTEV
jgi:hypothetical protein